MRFSIPGRKAAVLSALSLPLLLSSCGGASNIDFLYVTAAGPPTGGQVFSFGVDGDSGYISSVGAILNNSGGINAVSSVATKDAKWVYVVNHDDAKVVQFGVRVGEGTITPLNTYDTVGTSPVFAASDASNKYLYVVDNYGCFPSGSAQPICYSDANPGPGDISIYTIGSDGTLTPITNSTTASIGVGINPEGVAATPNAKYVYVSNVGTLLNGTVSSVSGPPSITILTQQGDGTYAKTSTFDLQEAGAQPWALAATQTNLYVTDYANAVIYSFGINADGTLTSSPVGTYPVDKNPEAVLINSAGSVLYVANYGANNLTVLGINSGGTLTPLQSISTNAGPKSIAITPQGGPFLYVANFLDNSVSGYRVASDGTLAAAPRFPISVNGTHISSVSLVARSPS